MLPLHPLGAPRAETQLNVREFDGSDSLGFTSLTLIFGYSPLKGLDPTQNEPDSDMVSMNHVWEWKQER